MKFEDPKPKTSQNKPNNIETSNENLKLGMESFLQRKINRLIQQATEQPDKKRFVINQLAEARETWFQENEDLLAIILAKTEEVRYENDAQFEKDVVKVLMKIIMEHIAGKTEEEVLKNFRILAIKLDNEIPLDANGVTSCSRYDDVAEVHITKGLTPSTWTEALAHLLKIVEEDKNIETIRMVSWFVAKKLSDFKKLGFTVSEIGEEEMAIIRAHLDESMKDKANVPWARAEMSRDEFLNSKIIKRISRV
jgi:ferritin